MANSSEKGALNNHLSLFTFLMHMEEKLTKKVVYFTQKDRGF